MDKKNQRDRDGRYTTKIDEKQNFALKHRRKKNKRIKTLYFAIAFSELKHTLSKDLNVMCQEFRIQHSW